MKKIRKNQFKSWKEYYHSYQRTLATDYYIPLIDSYIDIKDKSILEIGCGNGGFIDGFTDISDHCVGFDIKDSHNRDSRAMYYRLDVFDSNLVSNFSSKFNLIILRDVIEHLENSKANILFKNIDRLLEKDGCVLVTFPPFYSPFGLHQQVLLSNFLRYIPFLSILPKAIVRLITKYGPHNKSNIDELLSLYDSKQTISSFLSLINRQGYQALHSKYFHIRPSHEIRYGLKTIESKIISKIPIIRELLVSGTVYLIKRYDEVK